MSASIIAFSGKGGVGKTTLAALTLRKLVRIGRRPILAVDADPNATLAMTLGVDCPETIADLRDRVGEAAKDDVNTIPKTRLVDQWLAEILAEEAGFDLLAMGRPEGPKCYCYVNGLLRRYLSVLRDNYACVVVDCEAGMEYLSRLVIDDVASLVLVAEPTPVGLATAGRIARLADSLGVRIRRRVLAINKVGQYGGDVPASAVPDLPGVEAVVEIPFDADLAGRCARGEAIDDAAGAGAAAAVERLVGLCLGAAPGPVPATTGKERAE